MLSLDNAYDEDDLRAFDERLRQRRRPRRRSGAYVAELKIDGLSIALTYENGRLMRGATRGDGVRGEDVTAERPHHPRDSALARRRAAPAGSKSAAKSSCRAPLSPASTPSAKQRASRSFTNPRNAAAGTMRNLDPPLVRRRRLGAFTYQLVGARRTGIAGRRHAGAARGDARMGAAGRAALSALRRDRRGHRVLPRLGRQAPRRSNSTPTASSSSWTTWRCAIGWAPPPSFRAGPPPSSSPRSRSRPSCWRSTSTSAAPARTRRMPCSSRCSSPDRRSRWRRCTTPRTSRARISAKATRSCIEKAGDVIPRVVAPILSLRPPDADAVGDADRRARRATARCTATKRKSSGAARTPRAPRACAAASSTSPRARR